MLKTLVRAALRALRITLAGTAIGGIAFASVALGDDEVATILKPGVFLTKAGVITMKPVADERGAQQAVEDTTADEQAAEDEAIEQADAVSTSAVLEESARDILERELGAAPVSFGGEAVGSKEAHCLATAIYFEARGESAKGQKAVAEVIMARTRTPGRPKSICGVVYEGSQRSTGCQFSFTCDGYSDVARPGEAWSEAKLIASNVLRTRGRGKTVVRGATFYHADYVRPGWAKRMVRVAQIGSHIFYRPKRGRLS